MPVILNPTDYDLWLDPGMQDVSAVSDLLEPYDRSFNALLSSEHSDQHVANDDEECSRTVQLAQTQNRLFS
jgi:putative SOS response-associated peptidase YedK